jgi:RNA polymerase sigma factor (sigma-70 family)
MPGDSLQSVVQYLHRIIDVGPGAASDAELLDRFATRRDEAAFALLVYRHGPMILGVCQRVLRHEHDCEDVFQATFLTLARRANSISKKDSLASWLYKVAFRIACRARGKVSMLTNQLASLQGQSDPDADVIWRDLRPVLDQEIAQLPESQSRPIILCYLEGKTHEEAAELLGWPKGTLAARLARGRERLRQRLTRRGWTLSAAALATVLADKTGATAISAELMRSTVQAALAYVSGTSVAVLSAKAVALAEGVMQMMWYSKVKMAVVMLLAVALTGSGVGWAMFAGGAGPEQAAQKPKAEPAGDQKADIAAMRAEIAKLRSELDVAIKEIKGLKEGKPEQLYQGKPARYWLDQLNDADPKYRIVAVNALGALARKDKELISVLVEAMKDFEPSVGKAAGVALGGVGPEIVAPALAVLKDPTSGSARAWAAEALGQAGPKAAASVPALIQALKDRDLNMLQPPIVIALGRIGPESKPAVPVLLGVLEKSLLEIQRRSQQNKADGDNNRNGPDIEYPSLPRIILEALIRIDPELRDSAYPKKLPGFPGVEVWYLNRVDQMAMWQTVLDTLKKRFGKEK